MEDDIWLTQGGRIILKSIFKILCEVVGWVQMAQNNAQREAFINI